MGNPCLSRIYPLHICPIAFLNCVSIIHQFTAEVSQNLFGCSSRSNEQYADTNYGRRIRVKLSAKRVAFYISTSTLMHQDTLISRRCFYVSSVAK